MKFAKHTTSVSFSNCCGLIVCGGASSRMGVDKSLLQYFDKPQRYHVYDMLQTMCNEVCISCNPGQMQSMAPGYAFIPDSHEYKNIGPVAALLTAFNHFPDRHILFIGCDYPFLTQDELAGFSSQCNTEKPAAFFNEAAGCFEPLLAWYPNTCFARLTQMVSSGMHSLQHFLAENNAVKYYPANKNSLLSIDTRADFLKASALIKS